MKKQDFQHESFQDAESIEKYFTELVKGLQNGTLSMKDGNSELNFKPKGLFNFQIKAQKGSEHSKINIVLNWKECVNSVDEEKFLIDSSSN